MVPGGSGRAGDMRSGTARRPFLVLLGLTGLAVLAFGVAIAVAPDHNASGQCEGLGWGCTLTPRDSLVMVGLFGGLPALVVVLSVGSVVIAGRRRRGGRSGVGTGLLGFVAGLAACALIAAVLFLLA